VSAAPLAVRRYAVRRSDGPSLGRRATPAGRRPLRWRRRNPFPRPTLSPPRQRGCTCPRSRSRLWSRPACPVSMRRRARHRPEGQGIARTCLEFVFAARPLRSAPKRGPYATLLMIIMNFASAIHAKPCCEPLVLKSGRQGTGRGVPTSSWSPKRADLLLACAHPLRRSALGPSWQDAVAVRTATYGASPKKDRI